MPSPSRSPTPQEVATPSEDEIEYVFSCAVVVQCPSHLPAKERLRTPSELCGHSGCPSSPPSSQSSISGETLKKSLTGVRWCLELLAKVAQLPRKTLTRRSSKPIHHIPPDSEPFRIRYLEMITKLYTTSGLYYLFKYNKGLEQYLGKDEYDTKLASAVRPWYQVEDSNLILMLTLHPLAIRCCNVSTDTGHKVSPNRYFRLSPAIGKVNPWL